MAQFATATATADVWSRPLANDNHARPGDTDGDRWQWLISHFKNIDVSLAIVATRSRLSGMRCEDFCAMFLRGAKSAGWEWLEDWDG